MINIVFIQTEKEKINANSIESLVAIQNFSKQTNDEVYAITFNENVATKLKNYNLEKSIKELQKHKVIKICFMDKLKLFFSNRGLISKCCWRKKVHLE